MKLARSAISITNHQSKITNIPFGATQWYNHLKSYNNIMKYFTQYHVIIFTISKILPCPWSAGLHLSMEIIFISAFHSGGIKAKIISRKIC